MTYLELSDQVTAKVHKKYHKVFKDSPLKNVSVICHIIIANVIVNFTIMCIYFQFYRSLWIVI